VQKSLDLLIESLRCTVVLVAHRLSTVINADNIAVIHKGAIKEHGTHTELLRAGGIYSQLVTRQMARDVNKSGGDVPKKRGDKQTDIDKLIEELEGAGTIEQ